MISKITHISVMVRNQDEAAKFYMEKLGMEKRMDMPMDETTRWVTLGVPGQPDLELILQDPAWGPGGYDAEQRAALIGKGPGFIFETADCHKTYAEWLAKGVKFAGEPQTFPWGIQAVFEDLYGTTHVLSQSIPMTS